MKFSKSYIETLASSHFPDEWKRGAVDYKQLKKLIKGVVHELESIGLGADVLKDLLIPPAEEASALGSNAVKSNEHAVVDDDEHSEGKAVDGDDEEETPAQQWIDTLPSASHPRRTSTSDSEASASASLVPPTADSKQAKRRKSSSTAAKTPADLLRTHDTLMRRAESTASSTTASTDSGLKHGSTSGSGSASGDSSAGSVSCSRSGSARLSTDSARHHHRRKHPETGKSHIDSEGHRWLNGKDGRRARAEYELGGTPEHPVPRIRLLIESPVNSDDEGGSSEDIGTESQDGDDDDEDRPPLYVLPHSPSPSSHSSRANTLIATSSAKAESRASGSPHTLRGRPTDSPASSLIGRTPVITTAGVEAEQQAAAAAAAELEALPEPALGDVGSSASTDEQEGLPRRRPRRHLSPSTGLRFRRREIVIPLTADTQFLESLTDALTNLSRVQEQQREHFVAETENLCSSIARVASPYATHNDMYVWREIFALWVDSQIFESSREKDRGELSVEESEARLKTFAEELAKRGWIARPAFVSADEADVAAVEAEQQAAGKDGKKASGKSKKGLFRLGHPHRSSYASGKQTDIISLPDGTVAHRSHDPRTQTALDDFLKLNIELLDVKKFQAVNAEAARKILKKHDKRTALTASQDLRSFMAMQERQRAQLEKLASLGGGTGSGNGLQGAERLNLMEVNGGIAPRPLSQAPHALPLANFDQLSLVPSSASSSAAGRELSTTTTMTHPSLAALLPTSATGLMAGSLPHILLSLLTTTLLPILPSIEDSSCVICTSVAWRPVRLACSHLFCIRCLVKLQRQHRDDCPLCRAPLAVKNANGANLDEAMANLLKTYFPEEVKVKQRENDKEVRAEEEKEMGLEDTHCTIC